MTAFGIKVITAALAGALVGGAALTAQSNDAIDLDLNAIDDRSVAQTQVANDGDIVLPLDFSHPANLVVHCNIGGTEHPVASFEICDAVGGSVSSVEI